MGARPSRWGERRGGERTPSRALWSAALVAALVALAAVSALAYRAFRSVAAGRDGLFDEHVAALVATERLRAASELAGQLGSDHVIAGREGLPGDLAVALARARALAAEVSDRSGDAEVDAAMARFLEEHARLERLWEALSAARREGEPVETLARRLETEAPPVRARIDDSLAAAAARLGGRIAAARAALDARTAEAATGVLVTGVGGAALAVALALLLRRSLRALARSEARYRASFEGAHVGIAHVGLDGRWLRVNRRLREILGYDERELASLGFAEVTHPEDRALDAGQVERLVAGEIDGYAVEKRCLRRDGTSAWVSLTVALARDRDGRPTHLIAAMEDIAAHKAAEADLREAVRIRDEFLQVASHELRTPLTGLRLQIESLRAALWRDGNDGAGGRLGAKAEAALRQTARLGALVDGLLEVSRLGVESPALDLREGDVREVAADVVARHAPEAARAGTEITLLAPAPARARFDRARVELAIGQLVSNAVKYGASKPVEVEVSALGDAVRVVVRDRGIGVPPEDRERIFERFVRAVPASHYGGLGLGLFLARRVAEAHGGRIHVESTPGEGATFVIELPRHGAVRRAEDLGREEARA